MIWYLTGEIIELETNRIIVLINSGVWYELWISKITFTKLSLHQKKEFYIYHNITEANQNLFGFLDKSEKNVFSELIKISWIWWKVAIQILSLGINTLSCAIKSEDKKLIESIKWIGKKMAEKIIIELKDKDFIKGFVQDPSLVSTQNKQLDNYEDVIFTLTNMWYSKPLVEKAIIKIPKNLKTIKDIIPAIISKL